MLRGDKLEIFENFEINLQLPKWRKREEAKETEGESMMRRSGTTRRRFEESSEEWEGANSGFSPSVSLDWSGTTNNDITTSFTFPHTKTISGTTFTVTALVQPDGLIKKAFSKTKSWFKKKAVPKEEPKKQEAVIVENTYTVEEFFKELKLRGQKIKVIADRIKDFEKVLEYVKSTHQKALQERIEATLEIVRAETNLLSLGLKTVILEGMVVFFHKKCTERDRRSLRLDWIKNFARIIPEKLVEMKNRCDQLEIFDNYVILHYDPNNKGSLETKEEIAKKKDPILFGVISGSRNLYYIGDWIDEHCGLTLRAFIEEFGSKTVKANDLSTNIKVDDFV